MRSKLRSGETLTGRSVPVREIAPPGDNGNGGRGRPTIWGLTAREAHDRFWAARGLQVVRPGSQAALAPEAELFLLAGQRWLLLFPTGELVKTMYWEKPRILCGRLCDRRSARYREVVVTEGSSRLARFRRHYPEEPARTTRILVTADRRLARLWLKSRDAREGWRRLRKEVPKPERLEKTLSGEVFNDANEAEAAEFLNALAATWRHPARTIRRLQRMNGCVWVDPTARVDPSVRFSGPVWVGAGRELKGELSVVGPLVIWDDPKARCDPTPIPWESVVPTAARDALAHQDGDSGTIPAPRRMLGKRLFDILFSLAALILTLPLYPLVILAIWLQDGWPPFFVQYREALGGRRFPCIKFRSMKKNAEALKAQLKAQNLADGPQWHIEKDPRTLRIGEFLRKTKIDELPQFLNVLLGHMSVVGPRPSPFEENQFCPAWREARLSVRPGITGLWQVKRTRAPGRDFQEWIRYDIEYVENMSWRLDVWILWRTLWAVFRGK